MNLPEVSEKLIEQLNHGSTKAFDKIYHTYYLYLCAIAVYYVHDKRVRIFVGLYRMQVSVICGLPLLTSA